MIEFRPDPGDGDCTDGGSIAANTDNLPTGVERLNECGSEFPYRVGFAVGVIGWLFRLGKLPTVVD